MAFKKARRRKEAPNEAVSNHNELLSVLRKSEPLVVVWAGGYEANSIPILDSLIRCRSLKIVVVNTLLMRWCSI